jgi:ubiquitin C-terminal hydrolase
LCLIGKIDDDLNRVKAEKVDGEYEMPYIEYPPEDDIAKLQPKSKITDLFQEINLLSNQSIIQDIFSSDFKSTIICNGCGSVKIMLEKMSSIPVSLTSQGRDIKLQNQLKLYGQKERISENDACFYCRKCQALKGVEKSQEIL